MSTEVEFTHEIQNFEAYHTVFNVEPGTWEEKARMLPHQLDQSPIIYVQVGPLHTAWTLIPQLGTGERANHERIVLGAFVHLVSCTLTDDHNSHLNNVAFASFKFKFVDASGTDVLSFRPSINTKFKEGWGRGYRHLETLDELYRNRAKYFPDGTLRLRTKLTVDPVPIFHRASSLQELSKASCPVFANKLMCDMLNLYRAQQGTDFVIQCGQKLFRVHKLILGARSEYFQRMFETDMRENASGIAYEQDVEPETFETVLIYLYSGLPDLGALNFRSIVNVVYASEKYGFQDLKHMCFRKMIAAISLANCGELAILAYLYEPEMPAFKDEILEFCYSECNWELLIRNQEFKQLYEEQPAAFSQDEISSPREIPELDAKEERRRKIDNVLKEAESRSKGCFHGLMQLFDCCV